MIDDDDNNDDSQQQKQKKPFNQFFHQSHNQQQNQQYYRFSNFFEQLKLQHISECLSYHDHVLSCIDLFFHEFSIVSTAANNNANNNPSQTSAVQSTMAVANTTVASTTTIGGMSSSLVPPTITNEITINKLREALMHADSNLSRSEVNHLLARGCGMTVEDVLIQEAKRELISFDDFRRKLKNGLLKKNIPKQR